MPPSSTEPVVIAVDPGREKCGVAVVSMSGKVYLQEIVATSEIGNRVAGLCRRFPGQPVALGNGTASQQVRSALQSAVPATEIASVAEAHTTEMARERYWAARPPRGWRRLAPRSLLTPPEPLDDFAAALLAERWWRERGGA